MNQKYSQVSTLLAQGKLNWATGAISAMLFTDATFDASNKKVSDLGVRPKSTVPIFGRTVGEVIVGDDDVPHAAALGYPATFDKVDPGTTYQVIVGVDDGLHDLLLLAFIDTNDRESTQEEPNDQTLSVARQGSLIIRPMEEATVVVDGKSVVLPPTMGVWMRL